MDKTVKNTLNEKLKLPFIIALICVAVLVIGMFLPYLTAVGEMGEVAPQLRLWRALRRVCGRMDRGGCAGRRFR